MDNSIVCMVPSVSVLGDCIQSFELLQHEIVVVFIRVRVYLDRVVAKEWLGGNVASLHV